MIPTSAECRSLRTRNRLSCWIAMTDNDTGDEAGLCGLHARIDRFASTGDLCASEARVAAAFPYNPPTGLVQDGSAWLEGLKPLVGRRERLVSSVTIEVHGAGAVAMGDLDVVWGDGRHNYDRYVRVYRL